jgi:predicted transcriptional regulator
VYEATPEELEGIDRGLRDVAEGRFATDEEVEAVFAKFRRP